MLSFAEYVSALLGDAWRGQSPLGRRDMSAIFGATVAIHDDRPEQPDSIVVFTTSTMETSHPLTEGVLCDRGAGCTFGGGAGCAVCEHPGRAQIGVRGAWR